MTRRSRGILGRIDVDALFFIKIRTLCLVAAGNIQRSADLAAGVDVDLGGDDRHRGADLIADVLGDAELDLDPVIICKGDICRIGRVDLGDALITVIGEYLRDILDHIDDGFVLVLNIIADIARDQLRPDKNRQIILADIRNAVQDATLGADQQILIVGDLNKIALDRFGDVDLDGIGDLKADLNILVVRKARLDTVCGRFFRCKEDIGSLADAAHIDDVALVIQAVADHLVVLCFEKNGKRQNHADNDHNSNNEHKAEDSSELAAEGRDWLFARGICGFFFRAPILTGAVCDLFFHDPLLILAGLVDIKIVVVVGEFRKHRVFFISFQRFFALACFLTDLFQIGLFVNIRFFELLDPILFHVGLPVCRFTAR